MQWEGCKESSSMPSLKQKAAPRQAGRERSRAACSGHRQITTVDGGSVQQTHRLSPQAGARLGQHRRMSPDVFRCAYLCQSAGTPPMSAFRRSSTHARDGSTASEPHCRSRHVLRLLTRTAHLHQGLQRASTAPAPDLHRACASAPRPQATDHRRARGRAPLYVNLRPAPGSSTPTRYTLHATRSLSPLSRDHLSAPLPAARPHLSRTRLLLLIPLLLSAVSSPRSCRQMGSPSWHLQTRHPRRPRR